MNTGLLITSAVLAALAVFMLTLWALRSLGTALSPTDPGDARYTEGSSDRFTKVYRAASARLIPYLPGDFVESLSRRITMAGGLSGTTPAQIVLSAGLAGLFGIALGALLVLVTGWPWWAVLATTVGGALMPFIWLRDRIKQRHAEILADLPYHLDLLTLSVEAGLDFGAGVARMVDKARPGALRQEFSAFLSEIRLGKTRAEALQSIANRVGLEALSTFLAALIQADRMGSGIGRTLRVQAEQLRIERFQRAEKLAGEAPVKMVIPLVLFIFPTIWVILGAPLVFDWVFRGTP